MAVENKYTNIMSQHDDGSTALTIFTSVQQAKDYFLTANAQQCAVDNSTQVEYALVADDNGDNTKLKRTLGFDLSGQGQTYNNRMIELINADDWGGQYASRITALVDAGTLANNPFSEAESSEHLF